MQNLRWANDQHIGVCYDTPEAVVYVDSGELYQEILAGDYGPIGEPIIIVVPPPPPPTNAEQSEKRKAAYIAEADPVNFMMQRGEASEQEWLEKIVEIKTRYPYHYDAQGNLLEAQA
jgi:hypothetical protein